MEEIPKDSVIPKERTKQDGRWRVPCVFLSEDSGWRPGTHLSLPNPLREDAWEEPVLCRELTTSAQFGGGLLHRPGGSGCLCELSEA